MEDRRHKTLTMAATDWIAAVVSSGAWSENRAKYRIGITPELDPLVSWIDRSLHQSGSIPSYQDTKRHWPDKPWPHDVLGIEFATAELHNAYRRVDVIRHVRELDKALTEGSTNEAYQLAKQFTSEMDRSDVVMGVQLTDESLYEQREEDTINLESWGDAVGARPIKRSDFALLAARTGVGKSWLLLMAAMDAMAQGWDVVFYSLEMSADEQAKRLRILRGTSARETTRWVDAQPGRLYIIDQGSRRIGFTPSDVIKRIDKDSQTLIIVDYGELLKPESGGRATEGWNKSAEVSQSLQNVAKHIRVPVLAAVQDNRAAVGMKPGVETLSGSDYWGRDADLVLRLRDETGEPPGEGPTRVLEVVKSRHTGSRTPTYFEFGPDREGIRIIDRVQYTAIHARE